MQIYSTNNWIFVSYVLHLSELKNETGTGVRCYVLGHLYLKFFKYYLPTSFVTVNSTGLLLVVSRKLKVKKLEVSLVQISI